MAQFSSFPVQSPAAGAFAPGVARAFSVGGASLLDTTATSNAALNATASDTAAFANFLNAETLSANPPLSGSENRPAALINLQSAPSINFAFNAAIANAPFSNLQDPDTSNTLNSDLSANGDAPAILNAARDRGLGGFLNAAASVPLTQETNREIEPDNNNAIDTEPGLAPDAAGSDALGLAPVLPGISLQPQITLESSPTPLEDGALLAAPDVRGAPALAGNVESGEQDRSRANDPALPFADNPVVGQPAIDGNLLGTPVAGEAIRPGLTPAELGAAGDGAGAILSGLDDQIAADIASPLSALSRQNDAPIPLEIQPQATPTLPPQASSGENGGEAIRPGLTPAELGAAGDGAGAVLSGLDDQIAADIASPLSALSQESDTPIPLEIQPQATPTLPPQASSGENSGEVEARLRGLERAQTRASENGLAGIQQALSNPSRTNPSLPSAGESGDLSAISQNQTSPERPAQNPSLPIELPVDFTRSQLTPGDAPLINISPLAALPDATPFASNLTDTATQPNRDGLEITGNTATGEGQVRNQGFDPASDPDASASAGTQNSELNGRDGVNTAQQLAQLLGQSGASDGQAPIAQSITPASPPLSTQPQSALYAQQAAAQFATTAFNDDTLPTLSAELSRGLVGGKDSFNIQLNPSELGRVDVRFFTNDDGSVNARVVVERAETLDLFQRDVRALERSLQQSGIRLSDAGIDLSLRDNGANGSNGNGSSSNAFQGNESQRDNQNPRHPQDDGNRTLSERLLVEDITQDVPNDIVRTIYARFTPGQLNIEV